MPPRVDPIYLYGFCFHTQQRQRFNQSWACAFHTSWYTDENHVMWESVDDASKRREIRYGNNIYVLFRALLRCRDYYNHSSLWTAIAKGFNTSAQIVKQTAEILAEARKVHRDKPAQTVSDTAHAADDWIDFLNSRDAQSRPPVDTDTTVFKIAEDFFNTQEKKHINAAAVPISGRKGINSYPTRPPVRAPAEEAGMMSPDLPTSSSLHVGGGREPADRNRPAPFSRKRSATPPPGDRSPKSRRHNHDARPQPKVEPERHGAIDQLPTIKPTRSPQRLSHSLPPRPPQSAIPTGPAKPDGVPNHPAQPSREFPVSHSNGSTQREETSKAPAKPAQSAQSVPPTSPSAKMEERPTAATPVAVKDDSALKARIASLEKQLAETKGKLGSAPAKPSAPTNTGPSLREDVGGLKRDMASATHAISTMMESMHDIVDSLNSLQDEVSSLAIQQKDLATTISQPTNANTNTNLETLLQPIQTLTDTVSTLQTEISELKKTQPVTPALESNHTQPSCSNEKIETLLQTQNTRIDKLFRELATMQQMQRQQQQQQQQHHLSLTASAQQQPPPQTLRQAMAAAERDLKRHLGMLETFYHRGGASRAVTEQTADFMAMLADGVKAARAGQTGV